MFFFIIIIYFILTITYLKFETVLFLFEIMFVLPPYFCLTIGDYAKSFFKVHLSSRLRTLMARF